MRPRFGTLDRFLPSAVAACLGIVFLASAGCGKEKVEVYEIAKEPGGSSRPERPERLQWKTPVGWTELPASGMRVASFAVTGPSGESAEVAVVPLPGATDVSLLTVNMWRQELGLPEASPSDAAPLKERVAIANADGQLVELAAGDSAPENRKGFRTVGAMLARSDTTWVFKMTGPDPLVSAERERFKEFLKTLEFTSTTPSRSAMASPPSTAPRAGGLGAASVPANWRFPDHWKPLPASGMRLASFAVQGAGGPADLSVVKLSGMAGGVVENVNRWRGQIGLAPISDSELSAPSARLQLESGQATYVNVAGTDAKTGQPSRILGAIAPHGSETWFYKLTGPPELVASEEQAFKDFVKSAESQP